MTCRGIGPAWLCAAVNGIGCSREPATTTTTVESTAAAVAVDLPDSVLTEDATVNAFVRTAMSVCTRGDYEQFRALWRADHEPFAREQFDKGFQFARGIEVHKIQPMRKPDDRSLVYYVHASVTLAPGTKESVRPIVLLLVQDAGTWRLARPPKALVKRVLGDESKEDDPDA